MIKRMISALKRWKSNELIYPVVALCVDSNLGDDIIRRSANVLKQRGYLVITVCNFKKNSETDEISIMYDEMDMQCLRNADMVFGAHIQGYEMEESITNALKYAKDNGKKTEVLHFVT